MRPANAAGCCSGEAALLQEMPEVENGGQRIRRSAVLVLGFGKGHLTHSGNESDAVGDSRIIADFETYSESP